MSVSSISSVIPAGRSAVKTQSSATDGAEFAFAERQSFPGAAAAVLGGYDLQNISPAEIDQLVADLRAAGHPFDRNIAMLSSYGAEFRSHLAEIGGGEIDPHRKGSLIETIHDRIDFARSVGDPTDPLDALLDFLNRDQPAAAGTTGAKPDDRREPSVLGQMLRNLIETAAPDGDIQDTPAA